MHVEKPSRPATLRAVLRLHMMPNLPHIRLASILEFQLPRSNPLSDGGLSIYPLTAPSCSGVRNRGLPGLLRSCLHSNPSRPILYSHRCTVLEWRPTMSEICSTVSPRFLSMAA